MDSLLRAKHWQIFLFAYGIPWLLMLVILGLGFSDLFSLLKANPDPEDMAIVMSEFMSSAMLSILPTTLLSTAVSYGWMYAVNQRIAPMAPEAYQPNKKWVSIAILAVLLLTLLNLAATYTIYGNMFNGLLAQGTNPNDFDELAPQFLLLNMLSVSASLINFGLLIFISYQLSKALKAAELQRHLRSEDTIGPFFAFFFLFIGVWFMQPIVNKLYEEGPGGRDSLDQSFLLD